MSGPDVPAVSERQRQAREYEAFLRAKLDRAQAEIAAGQAVAAADVGSLFPARRAALRTLASCVGE